MSAVDSFDLLVMQDMAHQMIEVGVLLVISAGVATWAALRLVEMAAEWWEDRQCGF